MTKPAGSVRFFGLSEAGREAIEPAHALGRGFLTSEVKPADEYPADDMRSWDERWQPGNYERNIDAIRQLEDLAAEKEASVTQLALVWLLLSGWQRVQLALDAGDDRSELAVVERPDEDQAGV